MDVVVAVGSFRQIAFQVWLGDWIHLEVGCVTKTVASIFGTCSVFSESPCMHLYTLIHRYSSEHKTCFLHTRYWLYVVGSSNNKMYCIVSILYGYANSWSSWQWLKAESAYKCVRHFFCGHSQLATNTPSDITTFKIEADGLVSKVVSCYSKLKVMTGASALKATYVSSGLVHRLKYLKTWKFVHTLMEK